MIDTHSIEETIAVYKKYGWLLRRIILTAPLKIRLGADVDGLFGGVSVTDSDIDAAWFSRSPKPGGIAWELRHLSDSPFALLKTLDETDDGFEDSLLVVESQLRERLANSNLLDKRPPRLQT